MKKFIKYIIGISVMMLFSINIVCATPADYQMMLSYQQLKQEVEEEKSQTAKETDDTENVDWLNEFTVIKESEFKEKVKTNTIISATYNQESGNAYFTLENNEKYKIEDVSQEALNYIRVSSVELKSVNFVEESSENKKNGTTQATGVNALFIWIFLCSIISMIYMHYRRKRIMAIANGGVKEKSNKTVDGVEIPKVRFSDVEGIEDLKNDISKLVDCLKNPNKYKEIGARIPKGVILYGPPGTGKTLLAKALAGEAGVPFFSAVGSDFVEKYVGVGASRVRDLYKKARKNAPCIVFIDEIDAVASQRGNGENSERDQTINALLAELDGFDESKSIITVCATNRLDMLDSAFKRAGRFDLQLAVGLPDKKGRLNILKIHGKNKKFSDEVNLETIASKTYGFSGAELETLLNESALIAVGKEKEYIENDDIDDAYFKLIMKGNKKKREEITEMNRIVAWHESGHTLATKLLTDDSVPSVTIIGSSSGAGGVTMRQPKTDNQLQSKEYLESLIKVMYGGRAAEELYFKSNSKITTGASQDIKQATSIIKDYIASYGMGNKGMLDLSQFQKDFKNEVEEASILSKKLYEETLSLFKKNSKLLRNLAERLLDEETLEEQEIDKIIKEYKIVY